MRYFVIIGHKAATTGSFKLDDIAGGAGRLDILVRCVNSAFFLSHNLRKDVEAGYGVELCFSGAYAGDENDEVTVFDAGIYSLEDFDKSLQNMKPDIQDRNNLGL